MSQTLNKSQSVGRALDLLELVGQSESGCDLRTIGEALQLSQPAAYQLAKALTLRGYLTKSTRPVRYQLGRMVYELASRRSQDGVETGVHREAVRVAEAFPSVNVLVIEAVGEGLISRIRLSPTRKGWVERSNELVNPYRLITPVCALAFLNDDAAAALRRHYPFDEFAPVALAGLGGSAEFDRRLAEIRERGFALDSGDPFLVAAPIFTHGGRLWGAIGASVPVHDAMTPCDRQRLVESVCRAAADSPNFLAQTQPQN